MANVIKTVLTYPLDGSTRDFNIPFEYLARKFVVVTLIGVDRKVLTLNTDYRFATRTTISLTKSWGPADGYTTIELRRVTSTTDRLVDFTDGSILRAYDLNVAQIQTMHVAEEARDLTADTIGVNNDGHLDARGRRIVNLANAVDDRDAVPFGQLKAMNQNSWQARNEALQFRNEAETFRNQAEGFKNESSTNATNTDQWRNEAKGFRDEAEQFKNTATQLATSARDSATTATAQAGVATSKASESAASAIKAKEEADRAQSANPDNQLKKAENLNDIPDKAEARSNISVYSKAEIGSKLGYALVDFGIMGMGQRKVLPNPFGNSTPVITVAQVLVNGEWADAGWLFQPLVDNGVGIGCRAGFTELGIVVVTGSGGIKGSRTYLTGGIHETQNPAGETAHVRVHVWKVQP